MSKEKNYARKKKEDFNIWRTLFYLWAKYCVIIPYLSIFWRMKIYGKENIEKGKKYIVSPNHISYLDPVITSCVLNQNIAFMSKIELFDNKFLATVVDWLGAFAVNREKLEISTIKTVKEVFKTKWCLGIFPQGKIIRYDPISKVNKGFATIAKAAETDILPVGISGTEKFDKKHLSGKVTVRIGKPISHDLSIDEIMVQWAEQVGELSGYGYDPDYKNNPENIIV